MGENTQMVRINTQMVRQLTQMVRFTHTNGAIHYKVNKPPSILKTHKWCDFKHTY